MPRIPPALWLIGLAVGVSHLTREPAPRARPAPTAAARIAAPRPPPPAPLPDR